MNSIGGTQHTIAVQWILRSNSGHALRQANGLSASLGNRELLQQTSIRSSEQDEPETGHHGV